MSKYAELIERLEKAAAPDRELDGRIWAEVDGRDVRRLENIEYWGLPGLVARNRNAPHDECVVGCFEAEKFLTVGQRPPIAPYTASLDAALTLVPDGWAATVNTFCWVELNRTKVSAADGEGVHVRHAQKPAIALCIAALKAREAVE